MRAVTRYGAILSLCVLWHVSVANHDALNATEVAPVDAPTLEQARETIAHYPITSDALRCQPQTKPMRVAGLPIPIFLVDTSDASLAWLNTHAKTLIQTQALGWVVNARRKRDVDLLRAQWPDTVWLEASANELVHWLGVTHYPVLLLPAQEERTGV